MITATSTKHLPYARRNWMSRWARRVLQSAPDRQDKMGSRYYPQAYEEYKKAESVKQSRIRALKQKQVSKVKRPIKVGLFKRTKTQIGDSMKNMWIKTFR